MKKFFLATVVRPWPRLHRDVGESPFQVTLDLGALRNLLQLQMSLLTAGGLD